MTRESLHSNKEYSRQSPVVQSRVNSEQAYLKMKFSDDSSIFSGLEEQENEMNHMNQPRPKVEGQQQKGILRTSSLASPKHVVIAKESREGSELYSHSGSSSTSRSSRSVMREMRPMVDAEFDSGASTFSADSFSRSDGSSKHDGGTIATWDEANDMKRPKGSVKFVSAVSFLGENTAQEKTNTDYHHFLSKSGSHDSESRIVDLLNDFERQMDANIQSLSEDNDVDQENESNILTDFNKNILAANFDVQSQEPQHGQLLTPHKAKNLLRILDKTRQENEILRDNNEQYKSEIEQMEEEHRSEIKLVEDRAKHKLVELKNMYQNEIDSLAQEKDAAMVEAGRVAVKYAENEKKQVSILQKQIDKLKAAAAITLREKATEERQMAATNRDGHVAEHIETMPNSHQSELEKLKEESEERLKLEVEKTASSVAERVRLKQDVLISELTTQIDDLCKERQSITEVLESVKTKFTQNYPEQMIEFDGKSSDSSEGPRDSTDRGVEKNLMEVIEIVSFLLEGAEKKKNAIAQEKYAIEENNQESIKTISIQHRDEIEKLKREIEEKDEKLKKLEEDFRASSQDKRPVSEIFQRESENQKLEHERISARNETVSSIARSRKDLEHVMAAGQPELKERPEHGQFTPSSESSLALPSIQKPIDVEQSPTTIESPSFEKAKKFQRRHPNRFPRHMTRDSSRHRRSVDFSSNEVRESVNSNSHLEVGIINNPEPPGVRSVTSNSSLQSHGTLSGLQNQSREGDDQPVPDIIHSLSDTSRSTVSSDKSMRSKKTILSNFWNQSKNPKMNDDLESKESEEAMKLVKTGTENTPRRRKLALLRRNSKASKVEKSPSQVIQKEIEVKKENTDVLQRARMFRQFVEQSGKQDVSIRSRRSLMRVLRSKD